MAQQDREAKNTQARIEKAFPPTVVGLNCCHGSTSEVRLLADENIDPLASAALPIAALLNDLVLIADASTADEWVDQIVYLPLS